MISNNQPMEKFCAVSDSELASTDMNSCSQTFAIANSGYEANTKTGIYFQMMFQNYVHNDFFYPISTTFHSF